MLDQIDLRLAALRPDQLHALVARANPKGRADLAQRLERIRTARDVEGRRLIDRADPAGWVQRTLGAFLWSKQIEILEAMRDHQRVAVPACHGPGKSWTAARGIAHFISTSAPGEAMALTTAPTGPQVTAILWKEIGLAHSAGRLPGRVNKSQWYMPLPEGGEVLAGFGRKPADHNTAGFQGIHAPRLLVALDEADGILPHFWEAVESMITGEDSHVVAFGNPDDPSSYFSKILDPTKPESDGWHVIRISAFDLPCYTGEYVPPEVETVLTTKEWVEDKRRRWGEGNPLWSSKVLAIHPKNVTDAVVPWSRITIAKSNAEAILDDNDDHVLGVDVGGGGDDTVVCERTGWRAGGMWVESTPEPEDVSALVIRCIVETGASKVQVDSGGIGWGVCGLLREARARGEHAAEIVPVNAGSSATHEAKPGEPSLANMRSQLWWWAREHVADWDLSGVDDDTIAELVAVRWSVKSGRIVVEPKDDLRKRLGHSPDRADALLLCFVDLGPGTVAVVTAEDVMAVVSPIPARLVAAPLGYGVGVT